MRTSTCNQQMLVSAVIAVALDCNEAGRMSQYERGDYVRVEFADERGPVGERMWARIDSCDEEKRLIFGVLDRGRYETLRSAKLGPVSVITEERRRSFNFSDRLDRKTTYCAE